MPTKYQVASKEWIPLHRAVLVWALSDDSQGEQASAKPIYELTDNEIAESSKKPPSKRKLEELLKEKTGAEQVSINVTNATFQFGFQTSHGAIARGGPPWAFLKPLPVEFVEPTEEIVELRDVVKSGLVTILTATLS